MDYKIYNSKEKSIFNSNCDCLVNPVNTVGVMGAGLAKLFKDKYPINFQKYKEHCLNGDLYIGKCFTYKEFDGRFITNLPTKIHYRNPSEYSYVASGLDALVRHINHYGIKTIAIPALGAGLGGLDKDTVIEMITLRLSDLDIYVEIYF